MLRKIPSIGFLFLLLVVSGFVCFLAWSVRLEWYDRVHTPEKTQADHLRMASYLERLTHDSLGVSGKVVCYRDAAQLRKEAGQLDKAIAILEQGLYFLPDQASLRSMLFGLYEHSGQQHKAVSFENPLFSGDRQRRKAIADALIRAFGNSDPALAGRLPGMSIQSLGDGRTIIVGLSEDQWTLNGQPGYLVVPGFPDKKLSQNVFLSCYAADKDFPVTVTINGESGSLVHTFSERGREQVTLPPVEAGDNGIFKVTTDKYWSPPTRDKRKLGVCIQPVD